ncbi:putative diphthamide synthesis protein-domain-containing protein [Xylariomycetidae sp. FL2044]|nr:putative diphthamide synthesis protein-domain-containing protein [Xylariomycetidae sp. FL2044]
MASDLSAPPVLSTPAEHTFLEDPTPTSATTAAAERRSHRPADDELFEVYEIARTAAEIAAQGWKRIALQFPDAMLPDAPWIVEALSRELEKATTGGKAIEEEKEDGAEAQTGGTRKQAHRLYILADTSYSACCVDEIAAEHADADAVVHYGRACLSPTARLPVQHVFTRQKLDYDDVCAKFETELPGKEEKVVVMADVMFQDHVLPICDLLKARGYSDIVPTDIARDPTGTIPNRKLAWNETELTKDTESSSAAPNLSEYHLFHISTPPTSLLLTLSSRLSSLHIYPTPSSPYTQAQTATDSAPDPNTTPALLRRRYGLVLRLSTASIIGILVNTLSVKNYMSTISTLKRQIADAGKKSYTIVVGKLNAAKLANFAEIDGWVVVGCWESGLVEQEGLWKPVVTPFELGLALVGDEGRVWTGEWWGGIEGVNGEGSGAADQKKNIAAAAAAEGENEPRDRETEEIFEEVEGGVDEEESEPPEFDLRTGRLISNTRPMRVAIRNGAPTPSSTSSPLPTTKGTNPANAGSATLVKRTLGGQVAVVNGVPSPGAEFLRSKRTWQGLGTDFDTHDDEAAGEAEASTVVEEGRSGVARGYTVGEEAGRT